VRTREEVVSFLKNAEPILCVGIVEEFHLRRDVWLTVPAERAQILRQFGLVMRGNTFRPYESWSEVQGILVTKNGKVYYWQQWSDQLLCLRDDAGGTCVLQKK